MSKKNKNAGVSIQLIETSEGIKIEISKSGTLEDFATIRELLHDDNSAFAKSVLALMAAISKK